MPFNNIQICIHKNPSDFLWILSYTNVTAIETVTAPGVRTMIAVASILLVAVILAAGLYGSYKLNGLCEAVGIERKPVNYRNPRQIVRAGEGVICMGLFVICAVIYRGVMYVCAD
jgi:hypothetical protein